MPVTRISGEKPDVLSKVQVAKYHPDEFYVLPEVAEPRCVCGDENYPAPVQEKRGRSYTSFAKSTPYKKPDSGNREEDKAPQKRPFWRLLTR